MVQTLLAVVLGQAIFRNDDLLIGRFGRDDIGAIIGLCSVMFLALSSWMALAQLISEVPYSVHSKPGSVRLYADTAAVFLYSYLLLTIDSPESCAATSSKCALATMHYYGYSLVFVLYALASVARGKQEVVQLAQGHLARPGKKRPAPRAAMVTAGLLLLSAATFHILQALLNGGALRWVAVALFSYNAIVVIGYRLRWYAAIRRAL